MDPITFGFLCCLFGGVGMVLSARKGRK